MMPNSTTIRDVASRAGVSIGTVSRVFNNAPNISLDNLNRVRKAAVELGYQYDSSAQTSNGRRPVPKTKIIGIIFADMKEAWANHPLFATYVRGVEKACSERGYHPLVELASGDSELPRCVHANKVDGILVKSINRVPDFFSKLPTGLIAVGLNMNDPTVPIPQVIPDNRLGGWSATEYLWKRGHRRIAFLCDTPSHRMFIGRYQGYEEFMRVQRAFDASMVYMDDGADNHELPSDQFPDFTRAMHQLFSGPAHERPTAIVAANDWMAAGVYKAADQMGMLIPDDISIVGLDNSMEVCGVLTPPLTSYAVALSEAAYVATAVLIDRIEDPTRHTYRSIQTIPGAMVERASVRAIEH